MNTDLTTVNRAEVIDYDPEAIGRIANDVAARHVFDDYRERKAANTVKAQDADLALFAGYLAEAGIHAGDLAHDPAAWRTITWGLVAGFVKWLLARGYTVAAINRALSTVKVYCKLSMQAGSLDRSEYTAIRAVSGYSHKEAGRVNEARTAAGNATRLGRKKAEPVSISKEQAQALREQPDTPQGRRDRLLMCLLLDLGLRAGEVAGLTVDCFNLADGTVTFYRPKVDRVQTHRLVNGCLAAARSYLANDAPALGNVWRGSRKDGRLHDAGWTVANVSKRVTELGERLGIMGLSAHDCRHYWITRAARRGMALDRMMDAGGWSSPAMPMRYIEAAKIANEGIPE